MQRAFWQFLFLPLLLLLALPAFARGAETIPPKPSRYFNDNAGIVTNPAAADQLNAQLEKFERDTSNQVLVVIYPKMLSDSTIDDYTARVANAWQTGQKDRKNGTILFVFVADKKAFIQVGYGLEGALPDATCKQIIDEALEPAFKSGNYEGGLRAAIAGILTAVQGEYKGNGHTVDEGTVKSLIPWILALLAIIALPGILLFAIHSSGGTFYQQHVRSLTFAENAYMFFLNIVINIIFSAGSSSSSSSSSSSGGYSGGGGSFGGGGAGGSW